MAPTETEVDFADAIDVDSVEREYEIVGRQRCADCDGRLGVTLQSLLEREGSHYDLIETQCQRCGTSRSFLFCVDSFFGNVA